MAQLPPKIPSMTQNWPPFPPYQRMPPSTNGVSPEAFSAAATAQRQPSWVDEFLDFTAARRGAHRRSVSDSIAFLESPMLVEEEYRNSSGSSFLHGGGNEGGFDGLDDEQLLSMFSDDISGSLPRGNSSPSTLSDENSNDEEKKPKPMPMDQQQPPLQQPKSEPGEVESSRKTDPRPPQRSIPAPADPIIDPKRFKRILANRQSAQRSRVRKLHYVSELERSVTTLQTEVSALSPRVAFLDRQRLILNVDNSALKQRIAALAQDKIFKDAHQEALKKEIERLRQIYHQQNQHQIDGLASLAEAKAVVPLAAPPISDNLGRKEKEKLIS
ncbi:hypothetical protein Nepgr_007444 [Nepenthes gracilis]|uniref:BZIP domain-containing protein n=1 Tax=Nepenthes gracilis TaxID=150966 RepID=A0AAD3S772_NEPGR|nr:hypothetical protein Nepgr_007444 [Nepenthes gracilis]